MFVIVIRYLCEVQNFIAMNEDLLFVLRRAVACGGTLLFSQTDLVNRSIPYRFRLNADLSRYGILSDIDRDGMWYSFRINETGRALVAEAAATHAPAKPDFDAVLARTDNALSIAEKVVSVVKMILRLFTAWIILASIA